MIRLALLALLLFVGCNSPESKSTPQTISITLPSEDVFSKWPATTDKAILTESSFARMCSMAPTGKMIEDELISHKGMNILTRVNPEAMSLYKEGKPLPIGSVVVKEKYPENSKKLFAYAMMIKREKGYDPEHGNWEYVFAKLEHSHEITRGKMSHCINCHHVQKENDYLFRYSVTSKK